MPNELSFTTYHAAAAGQSVRAFALEGANGRLGISYWVYIYWVCILGIRMIMKKTYVSVYRRS